MKSNLAALLALLLTSCARTPVSQAEAIGPPPADIEGVGHAVVHSQAGQTPEQQRLQAIRAARLVALRDLAEQVYGARLTGDTTVSEAVVRDDQLRSSIEGLVRGAETVRINPVNGNTYEVVLKLPGRTVADLLEGATVR